MDSRQRKHLRPELLVNTVWRWFGSPWFWYVSLAFFALQAVYIALFGRFSMAFDEYYHLGTIQQYAKVWFPWSVSQPAGPAVIGSVTTDGSYLYHYLLSFPYRTLASLISNQTTLIITLRIIDVAIVVAGLFVFRRLLQVLGMSRPARQALLFVLMCVPMTPFLAGQLTYDALFFTLTATVLLVAVRCVECIRSAHRISLSSTIWLLALLAITSQVKYAFLPIAVAIAGFLGVLVAYELRAGGMRPAQVFRQWRDELRTPKLLLVVMVFVVSGALFAVRYGGNVVRYHSPLPKCDTALSRERCLAYGPYARDDNHELLNLKNELDTQDKATYPFFWFNQMVYESYFAVGSLELDYPTRSPMPVPYVAGYVLAVGTALLVLLRAVTLWRKNILHRMLLVIVGVYVLVLFAENYRAFLTTGMPVAIHGRYLLSLLPVVGFLAYEAVRTLYVWPRIRVYGIGLFMVLAALGFYTGGITVYIIRSGQEWYFQAAQPLTNAVRAALWPFVIR